MNFDRYSLTLIIFLSLCASAKGQIDTFTGTVSDDYGTAANWSNGTVPVTSNGATALINNGAAVTYTPGGDLIISNGGVLEITTGSFYPADE